MRFKWFLLLGMSLSMPLSAQQAGEGPHRIAYVRVPWILTNSPQVQAVEAKLKQDFIKREEALLERKREVDGMKDSLRESRASLAGDEVRQMERDIVSRERRLKIAEEEFQEDVALRKNEEINKLRRQISEVIQSVAREKNLDMVFETAVVYVSDRVDISEDVLTSLQRRFEADGGEPVQKKGTGNLH